MRLALRRGGVAQLAHIDTNGKAAQREAVKIRQRIMREARSTAERRARSEAAAAPFLLGRESPPPRDGERRPHR